MDALSRKLSAFLKARAPDSIDALPEPEEMPKKFRGTNLDIMCRAGVEGHDKLWAYRNNIIKDPDFNEQHVATVLKAYHAAASALTRGNFDTDLLQNSITSLRTITTHHARRIGAAKLISDAACEDAVTIDVMATEAVEKLDGPRLLIFFPHIVEQITGGNVTIPFLPKHETMLRAAIATIPSAEVYARYGKPAALNWCNDTITACEQDIQYNQMAHACISNFANRLEIILAPTRRAPKPTPS